MEHNVTTTYLLSGQNGYRTEVIAGRQQRVQAWNQWCIAINAARKTDILTTVKEQDEDLFRLLLDSHQKSESFFDELANCLHSEILKKQSDVDTIDFEFEGYWVHLSNLIPPGAPQNVEHYYWCER